MWRRAGGCGGEQTAVAASRRLWRRADGCGGEQTAVAASRQLWRRRLVDLQRLMRLRGERTSQKGVIENPPGARGSDIGGIRSLECLMQEADTVMPRKRKLSCGRGNREDPETRKERKQKMEEMERLSRSGEDKSADGVREAAVEITRRSRGQNIDASLTS
jgi:hypothetical protein